MHRLRLSYSYQLVSTPRLTTLPLQKNKIVVTIFLKFGNAMISYLHIGRFCQFQQDKIIFLIEDLPLKAACNFRCRSMPVESKICWGSICVCRDKSGRPCVCGGGRSQCRWRCPCCKIPLSPHRPRVPSQRSLPRTHSAREHVSRVPQGA